MKVPGIRARLAADENVGAGNVLLTLLEQGVDPDTPALTFDVPVDGHPAWQAFSLGRLDTAVRARAAALHALGVGPRDPVVVTATDAADVILCFLALTRLGAIPALLNVKVPAETAALYIRRLRPTTILADAGRRAQLSTLDTGGPLLTDVAELAGDPAAAPPPYRHHRDDPVAITHSSGTTGVPKAVVHSHASLFAAIRHRLERPLAQGTERLLSALPAPHAATLIATNQALSGGTELAALSDQSGAGVLDRIESWRPSGVLGFAATWSDLARLDLAARDLDSVALWWNTGDCAHEAHIRRLVAVGRRTVVTREGRQSVPGSVFIDGLGSSEMGHSHFHITHTRDTSRYGRCIGKPHAFAQPAVLDPDGNELPPNVPGELGTKSPTLALGYWNDSVTTYRTRVNGYFLTGDVVYRDEDGWFYHLDRLVDSVDLGGGVTLYTAMSEERILAACPEVADCTVVAVRDGGATVTDVLLQLRSSTSDDLEARVRAALGADVAATVRRVLVVDEASIPFGPTGKVRKFALREQHRATAGAVS
ncbi:MAG TPA: AMP-binding protein [Mycobacteriales bacterium]|nr:AMP-binding protein [Mycobacteriales bacterium]